MADTIPQAAGHLAAIAEADRARSVLCPLCWARPGRPCTITGPYGDHLARWLEAERRGIVTREELAAVIGGLDVIAAHVRANGPFDPGATRTGVAPGDRRGEPGRHQRPADRAMSKAALKTARRRYQDFPRPVGWDSQTALYDPEEVLMWHAKRGTR